MPTPPASTGSNNLTNVSQDITTGLLYSSGSNTPLTIPTGNLTTGVARANSQVSGGYSPTVVLLGTSITMYNNLIITVASNNVTGNGQTTTVTTASQPVLDGAVTGIWSTGAPFDQQAVTINSVTVNNISFPSTLKGNPTNSVVFCNSFWY